jgi:hypothetical protein
METGGIFNGLAKAFGYINHKILVVNYIIVAFAE